MESLYRLHAQAVFRFAYGLSRDRTEAEDIVAETFARVVTRAATITSPTARAYLLTVARNVFLDGRRRSARDERLRRDIELTPPAGDDRFEDRDRLARALEALGGLSEGERAALLLRVDHDLSYDEIAATLNISVAAAKVRVHRARLRLAAAQTPEAEP